MTNIILNDVLALGFVYDQVAVPTSPAVGETWRQRDNSNTLMQDWYWNGVVWLSINLYNYTSEVLNTATTGTLITFPIIEVGIFINDFFASLFPSALQTGSLYWTVAFNHDTASFSVNTIGTAANDAFCDSVEVGDLVDGKYLSAGLIRVGGAGAGLISSFNVGFNYRKVYQ